jgi:hypothetical protein
VNARAVKKKAFRDGQRWRFRIRGISEERLRWALSCFKAAYTDSDGNVRVSCKYYEWKRFCAEVVKIPGVRVLKWKRLDD